MSNLDTYRGDLQSLLALGEDIHLGLVYTYYEDREELDELDKELSSQLKKRKGYMERKYQRWYTESYAVIKQVLPDRLAEFEQLYKSDGKRKDIRLSTYTIQDWLNGIRLRTFDVLDTVRKRFLTQLGILQSVEARFESTLLDIRQLVQADLFDSELDAARELSRHGFLRAAGAVSGVVLEKHLAQVAANHSLRMRKKNPSISDLNNLLKKGDVLDVPPWREIQRLGDLRNLCDHNKDREPTKEEVEELIAGVEKYTKSLF